MVRYLFLLLAAMAVLLYTGKPDMDSFRRHLHRKVEDQSGPITAILTNFKLWMSHYSGSLTVKDYLFFRLIHTDKTDGSGMCPHLGILYTWIPLCWSVSLPDCSEIGGCHGKGVCLRRNACICLPSFKSDEGCSGPIYRFTPLVSDPLLTRLSGGLLERLGWLEVLMAAFLIGYLLERLLIDRSSKLDRSKLDGSSVFKFFRHGSLVQLLNNLYTFYTYAPLIYSAVGPSLFGRFVGALVVASGLASMLGISGDETVAGPAPLMVALKTCFILLSSSWSDRVVWSLVQMFTAHLILEYLIVGRRRLGLIGQCGGLLGGYIFYRQVI